MNRKCSDCKWFEPHKNNDRVGIGFCYCDDWDNCGLSYAERVYRDYTDISTDCNVFKLKEVV